METSDSLLAAVPVVSRGGAQSYQGRNHGHGYNCIQLPSPNRTHDMGEMDFKAAFQSEMKRIRSFNTNEQDVGCLHMSTNFTLSCPSLWVAASRPSF